MRRTSDKPVLVLYHAVSSYQLLEVMLHRRIRHPQDKAVLILPDFIVGKYPQYKKLSRRFFDRVCLFPYLQIPHVSEEQVLADTARFARRLFPRGLSAFSAVYVAGAHFYFSLYLIQNGVPFTMFEDAAGMISRPEHLRKALACKFPLHAALAGKYGLFDGSQPLVRAIICLKDIQTRDVSGERYRHFSVEDTLEALPDKERKKLIRFFVRRPIQTDAHAVLLTQQFSNLGILREDEQIRLYENLRSGALSGVRLIIKKHPDDPLDYTSIFPQATVIREIFPAELLPYVFQKKPETVYTWDSTGCENLRKHFQIRKLGGKPNAGQTASDGREFDLSAFDSGSSAVPPVEGR
mgnify:CR=1 FL=1